MALGNLVMEDTGNVTDIRVLSTDAEGTRNEVSLSLSGNLRGVPTTTTWKYTTLTRPDGSIYGSGEGVMTTQEGDVINLIGHGSGQTPPEGGVTKFRTMLHAHTTAAKYADLNSIGLVGEYDVAADGSAVNKNWEWK